MVCCRNRLHAPAGIYAKNRVPRAHGFGAVASLVASTSRRHRPTDRRFHRFALQGRGTPAPWAPPERFVERGSYRFLRSPMYLGVLLLIVGQALVLGREILYLWAVGAWLMFTAFLAFFEEPQLRDRFGAGYDDYRRRVHRWLPTRPSSSRY